MRSDPFSPAEVAVLRGIVTHLEGLDDLTGGWTTKVDARRSGFSLHVRFDKEVPVFKAIDVATVFENAPVKLMQVVARVVDQLAAAGAS